MNEDRNVYEIHGTVTGRKGLPLRDARVVAWWQQIRDRRELAAGVTSEDGRYRLRYTVPEELPAPLLLVVEAHSEKLDAPLVSPLTKAQPRLIVNLSYEPADQSEWATLVRAIEPVAGRLRLDELVEDATHQDLSFLAQELNRNTEDVMQVALSARLEAAFKVPAPVFYAFLRQRIPAALPSPLLDASQNFTLIAALLQNVASLIFALSVEVQTDALTAAVALDIIGPQFTQQIPELVATLQQLRGTDLLNQTYLVGNTTLAQLLDVAALPAEKQQTFAQALATNNQSMRNFWRTLGDGKHGFTAAEASAIERTLSIGAFVKNFVPLIQKIAAGFTSGTYTTLPDLARLTLRNWVQLVNETGAPPNINAAGGLTPAEVFAAVIYTRITRAYPTAALSSRIASSALVPAEQQAPLERFFQNNPDLELIKYNIPVYLVGKGDAAFAGISEADQVAVVSHARSFQRVLRVAPNTDAASSLLKIGIKSATQISSLGEQQFFNKATAAGLTKPEANQVFQAAQQRYASLVSLYLRLNADSLGVLPKAIAQLSGLNGLAQGAIEKDQSLAVLFGSQDYCATDDCTSILSPAAYLCDLLLWLRNHQQVGETVLDVLDSRRPDIRHLLLNCPNTDTELPYIDLVIELLADKISPPVDALLTSFIQKALQDGTAYYYIVTAVNAMGESAASAEVSATPIAAGAPPAAPGGVSAATGNSLVTISWNPVAGAASYNIYWSTTPGVTTATGTKIQNAARPYVQTGLTNGTTYYYIVTAVNAAGESAASAQVSAAPAFPVSVPAAPAGVIATPGDTQVTITWNAVPGADSYNLYWLTSSGVTTSTGNRIPGVTSPYLQTALVDGTQYFYIVTAVNSVGESAASAQASATPAPAAAVPNAPAGLAAVAGDSQLALSWSAVAGATSYNIYWSTTPGVTTTTGTRIAGRQNPKWKQTSANKTAAELAAAPEYFNQAAFSVLFGANYPFSLPYSAGLDELRTYLQQWKVPLWQLRQALLPLTGVTVNQKAAVAAERFGIPLHGQDLMLNPNFVPRNVAWNTGAQDPVNVLVPLTPGSSNPAQLAFLPAAGISYEQLLELLELSWVQGGAGVFIQGITDSCDTSAESLSPSPLDTGFLDRAHRFLRLWNSAGYKMWELDLLLRSAAVANGTLDANGLAALFSFRQLQDATGLAVDQQLAFYQDIDTSKHRDPDGTTTVPLYARIFLNPSVTSVVPDPDLDVLPSGGTVSDLNLLDHAPTLQAALGVSASDLSTLIALTTPTETTLAAAITDTQNSITVASDAGFPAPNFYVSIGGESLLVTGVSGGGNTTWAVSRGQKGTSGTAAGMGATVAFYPLTIANLSLIYRVSALATTAKYSIPNLIALAQLLNPGAANPAAALAPLFASPVATLTLLSQAKSILQSGISLDSLTYLLTPPLATTLAAPIGAADPTLTVTSAAGFPSPDFYISIGSEVLQVTAVGGIGNTTWTVLRGQQGTTGTTALAGASVELGGGWVTSSQMTPANIAATLAAVQQAIANLPTILTSPITAADTTLTVASDANFPPPNFYVSIGAEILLVTGVSGNDSTTWTVLRAQQGTTAASAVSGADVTSAPAATVLAAPLSDSATSLNVNSDTGFPPPNFYISIGSEILLVTAVGGIGNTTWTVQRGQQNTTAAASPSGASVIPSGANLNGSIITAVASNAHTANNSGLANDVTSIILNTLQVPGTGLTLLSVLEDPMFTGSKDSLTAENFPNQFLAIQLFDKAGVLVRGVRLVASDLKWLLSFASVYRGLDFTQLPVTPAQAPLNLSSLLTTLLLIKLARLWTSAAPQLAVQTLYDLIAGIQSGSLATEAATQAALASITGWPLTDIAAFCAAMGFAFPATYTQPAAYDGVRNLEAMADSAGASGAQMVSWGTIPPDEVTAEAMAAGALAVLKSQQASNAAWLTIAPGIMNPIRDRRSTALQSYLIGQRDSSGNLIYGDPDGLFDYFLIDTQMTSCQVTSRVVQAYIAVQTFVERCLLNLEAPGVVIDPNDTTWSEWQWRSRYRIWEANREVFLYPENWLIESQRPNRTEIFQKLEQEVHQGQSTSDYLETVVLNYIDRLDGLSHLLVTGTCEDPASGDIYVVARTIADPPVFYYRSYSLGDWSGWVQVPLDIKAHQAVPALFRGQLCLFWMQVNVSNEPQQPVSAAQQSSNPPHQSADRYVTLAVYFSVFRNNTWAPAQAAKGKLFDKPIFDATSQPTDVKSIEALYTIKTQSQPPKPGIGATLFVDVFRLGNFSIKNLYNEPHDPLNYQITGIDNSVAVHLGRAVFDGRFSDIELQNLLVPQMFENILNPPWYTFHLLSRAQTTYGADAEPLLTLDAPDPSLASEPGLRPEAGALCAFPNPNKGSVQNMQLTFTSAGALEQNVGPLLNTAQVPLRVVAPNSDLNFDPASYFFFQDNRRCYWVESQKFYWTGSMWSPVVPSSPASTPFEVRYWFHVFYHPFTRLFWHQLSGGGFEDLYNVNLQQNPDQIDSSGSDIFSFNSNYAPTFRVTWDHDDVTAQDRQFLDFRRGASSSVYNWELFYHIPNYIALLLSQNQQFEDSRTWYQYIFNPTRQGSDPVPQRFWIPKPLHNLTTSQILSQEINNLLQEINQGDPSMLQQVQEWQADPFNPFLLADLRLGVPYMKSTVMAYLDNLIAWGDNLFSSESREALSEATLLYVVAAEILGPTPIAITPTQHADQSFDQLEPALDAFANALVEIENVIGGAGGGGGGGGNGGVPLPQTFYFKIPPNQKLLGYWTTVGNRLFKMRHCQSISGAPLQLALFDAPIDPGLLIAAQAAGVDLSSVLFNIFSPLPNYRFTALYPVALDFVNAVRAYGALLLAALEKSDGDQLATLLANNQMQLLTDADQIFQWQVDQAQNTIDALNINLQLGQQRSSYYLDQSLNYPNTAEGVGISLASAALTLNYSIAIAYAIAAGAHLVPFFTFGASGFGGSPQANAGTGGKPFGDSFEAGAAASKAIADAIDKTALLCNNIGKYAHSSDDFFEKWQEQQTDLSHTQQQIAGAQIALEIAQQNQANHQAQEQLLQNQIDFLTGKFTNQDLYDWMVGQLSTTYFQSYQLAYQMCKAVERCYQFELGSQDTFVQFGYWDSLHKGLLAGETLNHDLRSMQSSYLQENSRRYELSRYVSLGVLAPAALQQLLVTGSCDFTLPESLFDNDYPGHYNRRLTRVSMTVVYPSPGKFDNVKATLTLLANQVRVSTDTTAGYPENPVGSDSRFAYNYAAVPQKIAMGNAQDDPGLFVTAIASNIVDPRYLPFENAGAISSWHLELPAATNEIDLSTVGDVMLHLYYTGLDGGSLFQQTVQANNTANLPTSGIKVFSAQNDFTAPPVSPSTPYPLTPWQAFISKPFATTTTLTTPITPAQTVISVASDSGFPAPPFFVNIGDEILQVTAVSGSSSTTWTVARAQQGTTAQPAAEEPIILLPSGIGSQVFTVQILPAKFPPWTRGKTITVTSITVITVSWPAGVSFVLAPLPPLPTATINLTPVAGVSEPNVCSGTISGLSLPLGTWSFQLQKLGASDFHSLTKNDIGDILLLLSYNLS